jgi:hypothetical protein
MIRYGPPRSKNFHHRGPDRILEAMRSVLIVLALFVALPARAQQQADDDEKPASSPPPATQTLTNDTPPAEDAPPPPVERRAHGLHDDGDSPVRLKAGAPAGEGNYAGVSLGGQGLPPHPPKLPLKGPQRMTWPGFQIRDGVPTVFLQTTGAPDYAVSDTPGAIRVTLHGTKIQLRNNKRPLKVGEFGTPITEVSAKPHGKDVVVTIKHKGQASHREHVEPSAGGFQVLVVELPSAK